jgi:hypothetical protein
MNLFFFNVRKNLLSFWKKFKSNFMFLQEFFLFINKTLTNFCEFLVFYALFCFLYAQ